MMQDRAMGGLIVGALLVLWAAGAHGAPQRWALLMGVGKYRYLHGMQGPVNDTSALREVLERRWGFPPEHVATLLDGQVTKAAMAAAMAALVRHSKPSDQVFIYFSGHGTSRADPTAPWPLPDTTGALVPADFSPKGTLDDQLRRLFVGRSDLRPYLEALDAGDRHVFVAIDACFSGNAVRAGSAAGRLPVRYVALTASGPSAQPGASRAADAARGPRRGRASPPYPYRNVVFLSAAREYEFAAEIDTAMLGRFPTLDGRAHGAFTDSLLRVLNGSLEGDADGDGRITYLELEDSISRFMRDRGYPQRPQLLPSPKAGASSLLAQAVLGATVPASSDPTAAHRETLLGGILRGPEAALRFALELDLLRSGNPETTLREGDSIAFSLRPERTAYLVLLAVDSQGGVTLIYPDPRSAPHPVSAGSTVRVPDPRSRDRIVVSAPFGRTAVVALAYARPPAVLESLRDGDGHDLGEADLEGFLRDPHRYDAEALIRLTTEARAARGEGAAARQPLQP